MQLPAALCAVPPAGRAKQAALTGRAVASAARHLLRRVFGGQGHSVRSGSPPLHRRRSLHSSLLRLLRVRHRPVRWGLHRWERQQYRLLRVASARRLPAGPELLRARSPPTFTPTPLPCAPAVNMILTALERAAAAGNGDKARTRCTSLRSDPLPCPLACSRPSAACPPATPMRKSMRKGPLPLLTPPNTSRCPAVTAGVLRGVGLLQARLPRLFFRRRHLSGHAAPRRRQGDPLPAVSGPFCSPAPRRTRQRWHGHAPAGAHAVSVAEGPLRNPGCFCSSLHHRRRHTPAAAALHVLCLMQLTSPVLFRCRLFSVLRPGGRLLISDYCKAGQERLSHAAALPAPVSCPPLPRAPSGLPAASIGLRAPLRHCKGACWG